MPNVLTNLAADAYKAADMVGRELVGCIPSATINAGTNAVAKDQTVRSHVTNKATAVDVTPSMTIPEGTDQTVDNKQLTMTKFRSVQIPWTGEDQGFVNKGAGFQSIFGDQMAQAMRTLTNEAESDLATEIYTNASRAVGTAGTAPFASNHDLFIDARRILVDNGMPAEDGQVSAVLNTLAGGNLRKLPQLQKVDESGSEDMLRRGVLGRLSGIAIRESAQIKLHTKGTGTGYLLNGGEAVDSTTWETDTGTGTIIPGDIITAAADTDNNYVVNTALSGGSFTVGDPGARIILPDNNALTIGDSYTANLMFHRAAAEIAFRPNAMPEGGDAADDVLTVQDPVSGLVFTIAVYRGYKKTMIDVGLAWGVKAWNSDAIAIIMG